MDSIFYWEYELKCDEDGGAALRQGVICAENYLEAVRNITNFYGDKNIIEIDKIIPVGDYSVYEFNNPENFFKVEVK